MEPILETRNLTHTYIDGQNQEMTALKGINLSIAPGEFVAIIGTNGSGKSTLARHFNGLLLPTEGQCLVAGMDTSLEENLWPVRQQVGMVLQNPDNQIVAAIVEEDVAFGLENIGVPGPEIRPRVQQALEVVGMTEYAKHAPHRLSGGQKQRVAIAGVLALEPRCIVFDEPTAMLDPKGRQEIVSTVLRLNKEKHITIVYITHKMEEAILADRIIAMDQGTIALEGTPKEVFTQVDRIRALGLECPLAAEVANVLNKQGHKLPPILTHKELCEALCPSK
ncbi:energy-coupling factor transporter ATPase [Acidaminococcus sp. NSJ-142]|uniref:energy-coupling factor transporter ATPase n=1 Tax=Acidaminococcus TaxID=904 RepID=UPI000CF8CDFA|nr:MULTISPECIES: energy-coupling factor transporter ATPase [Acidaminococcus]MCD2435659.1 energy-coupling factor transporter ATPase [Acidaminococcus hominis]MCH4097090.1 energy-coupling factor transporter ATPase [Acidaminococcus provencensis]RHK01661.1 energy-coupling factor transporter ATPase [Acidaminococcus sp. AM05-11]